MTILIVFPLENQPHARVCKPAYLLPFPFPDKSYNTTSYQSAISKILFYFTLLILFYFINIIFLHFNPVPTMKIAMLADMVLNYNRTKNIFWLQIISLLHS